MMLVKAPIILVPAEFSKWPCISTPCITWGRTVNSPATEPIWLKTQSCVTVLKIETIAIMDGTLWPSLGSPWEENLFKKNRMENQYPSSPHMLKDFFALRSFSHRPEVQTVAENLWVRPEAWKAMAGLVLCSWCVENAECRLGSRSWSKHTNKHNEH